MQWVPTSIHPENYLRPLRELPFPRYFFTGRQVSRPDPAARARLRADGIRVNAIAVGFTVVEWFEEFLQDPVEYRHVLDCHPIGRLGRPEDMANAVLYLASDEASFVTGSTLVVDGA